jgi:hypothetical protein
MFDPKKLGEEADELIRNQAKQAEEGDTPEVEETQELVEETETVEDEAIAQAESTTATETGVQSEEIPSDDAVDNGAALAEMQKKIDAAEQRWKVLQGMIAKKDTELDTMRELIADMNRRQPEQEVYTQAPVAAERLITDADISEYGKEYVDFAVRAGSQGARDELSNSQLIANMEARIAHLEGSVEGVAATSANTSQNMFYNELSSLAPDWQALNNDASFLQWLDQVDPYAGAAKKDLLQHAASNLDATRAAEFFNAYLRETQPQEPTQAKPVASRGKDKLVAPGKTKATAPQADEKHVWTRAEIAKLYDDKMAGKITAKEFDRLERDIFAAQSEGRVAA